MFRFVRNNEWALKHGAGCFRDEKSNRKLIVFKSSLNVDNFVSNYLGTLYESLRMYCVRLQPVDVISVIRRE